MNYSLSKAAADVCVAGGNAVVQSSGGAAPVQLRHAGGPVERRLHLRRDVQEEVSEKRGRHTPVKLRSGLVERCVTDGCRTSWQPSVTQRSLCNAVLTWRTFSAPGCYLYRHTLGCCAGYDHQGNDL